MKGETMLCQCMKNITQNCLLFALLLALAGCAEFQGMSGSDIFQAVLSPSTGTALDEQTVASGLKEALRVGTERTVEVTSKPDGFLANPLIHIALPEQYQTMARALRTMGLGSQVDALEDSMNHAAELAAGEAKTVFIDAISQMTLADAYGILNGGDTAATDYFRDRTSGTLRNRFQPIVESKMGEVGLYRTYNQLMDSYTALPLTTKPPLDLDEYVTEKSLDGLFTVLSQEEQKIREDPAARTTELLRQVFSQ